MHFLGCIEEDIKGPTGEVQGFCFGFMGALGLYMLSGALFTELHPRSGG
jgi:hypothetical protein